MSEERKEYWEGSFNGVFETTGIGLIGRLPVGWLIPFNISMRAEESEGKITGNYTFKAAPVIFQPTPTTMNYPGIFDLFPPNNSNIEQYRNSTFVFQNYSFNRNIAFEGTLEVKKHSNRMELKFIGVPEKILVQATGMVKMVAVPAHVITVLAENTEEMQVAILKNLQITLKELQSIILAKNRRFDLDLIEELDAINGPYTAETEVVKEIEVKEITIPFPVYAHRWLELGFFCKDSSLYMPSFTLKFNMSNLAFEASYDVQKQRTNSYPQGATDSYKGKAEFYKVESYYSYLDGDMKEAKYVEQVDLTELRKAFIENPEIIEQMKAAAEKEIQEGLDEGLYSPKLVKMLDSLHKKGSEEEEE